MEWQGGDWVLVGRPVPGSHWGEAVSAGGVMLLVWALVPGSAAPWFLPAALFFDPAHLCWDHPLHHLAVMRAARAGEGFSYHCQYLFWTCAVYGQRQQQFEWCTVNSKEIIFTHLLVKSEGIDRWTEIYCYFWQYEKHLCQRAPQDTVTTLEYQQQTVDKKMEWCSIRLQCLQKHNRAFQICPQRMFNLTT